MYISLLLINSQNVLWTLIHCPWLRPRARWHVGMRTHTHNAVWSCPPFFPSPRVLLLPLSLRRPCLHPHPSPPPRYQQTRPSAAASRRSSMASKQMEEIQRKLTLLAYPCANAPMQSLLFASIKRYRLLECLFFRYYAWVLDAWAWFDCTLKDSSTFIFLHQFQSFSFHFSSSFLIDSQKFIQVESEICRNIISCQHKVQSSP
jgi:hypothetical protein